MNTILNKNDYFRLKKYQLSYLYLTEQIDKATYSIQLTELNKERKEEQKNEPKNII